MEEHDPAGSYPAITVSRPSCSGLPIDRAAFDEIIDVRSPLEYLEDHIPGAINLPVLDDAQRAEVGTDFQQVGSFEAKRSGAALITANISRHLAGHFADKPRDYRPLIYCWRGGQRSQSLAIILAAIGWRTHVLEGGYKAYRKSVRSGMEELPARFRWVAINGLTGSGKTRILTRLHESGAQVVDLEALANHKGSVLGLDPAFPQPSQKAFESQIHHTLSCLDPDQPVFVEAESKKVGNLHCPEPLWKEMTSSTVLWVEVPSEARVAFLLEDYGHFLTDPELLRQRIGLLLERYGQSQLDAWEEKIAQADWPAFVRSILEVHYDPSYRRSTRYPAPGHRFDLTALTPAAIDNACAQMIDLTRISQLTDPLRSE